MCWMVPVVPLLTPRRCELRRQTTRSPVANSLSAMVRRSGPRRPSVSMSWRASCVELGDVAAAQGEHDVAGQVVAGVLPPVGEQPRPGRDGAVGDDEPLALLGVGEVVAADAGADASERVAFELVVLAAVLGQLDRAVAFDDAGEEAACADGGELVRVADQDRLAAGSFDQVEHRVRGRGSRPCRPRRSTSTRAGRERRRLRASSSRRWSVVAGMPVSSWSFSAATPDGAAPSTGMPACAKTCGDGACRGGLAGAGEADDADDPARAGGDLAHHRLLLGGERESVGALDLRRACSVADRRCAARRGRARRARVRPARWRRARRSSSGPGGPGSVPRRPARRRRSA